MDAAYDSISTDSNARQAMLVNSWIRNEGQCVTLSQVALELGMSRPDACKLLEEQVMAATTTNEDQAKDERRGEGATTDDADKDGTQHRVTWCEVTASATVSAKLGMTNKDHRGEEIPCTVFRLVSGDVGAFQKREMDDGSSSPTTTTERTICALSNLRTSTESVEVAHERHLARCRDDLASNPRALLLPFTSPPATATTASATTGIAPSPEMQALWTASLESNSESVMATTGIEASSSSALARGVRTKTTASSFFGSGKPKGGESTLKSSGATKSKLEDEKENKESGATSKAVPNRKSTAAAVTTKPAANSTTAKPGGSLSSAAAAAKPIGKAGTADDFVGDMDTDSDDEEEDDDVVMKHRNDDDDDDDGNGGSEDDESPSSGRGASGRKAARPKPSRGRTSDDDADDNKESHDPVELAKPRPTDGVVVASSQTGKATVRRRKRVVEKTFKDEYGYLQTELQEVWEDVPVEESIATTTKTATTAPLARPASAAAKPAAKRSTTGKTTMKQGSLMGFFAKK